MSKAPPINVIQTTQELAAFCDKLAKGDYIALDTEFSRSDTYYSKLCLIQAANDDCAAVIDTLTGKIDFAPFLKLLGNPKIVKVFHAARQDLEIFFHLTGDVAAPLFDTQVAAMVCGYGDQAAYETLASRLAGARIDKSARFANWAKRPLTPRQLEYALSDVTHLRVIYKKLSARLKDLGREKWIAEEMAKLSNPATYASHPEDAWQRLKTRSRDRRFLGRIRAVAAWREELAQDKDLPRNRVLRDDQVMELAAHPITDFKAAKKSNHLGARGRTPDEINRLLKLFKEAAEMPDEELPNPQPKKVFRSQPPPVVDLLKVLLKMCAQKHDVAPRLIATVDDLEKLAAGRTKDVECLSGWRAEIFGDAAGKLLEGRLAMIARGGKIELKSLN